MPRPFRYLAEANRYALVFLLSFVIIACYNASIQSIPNFSYRVLPTGHWQITDERHETMTPATVITAVQIEQTTYPLDKNWLFASFYNFKRHEENRSGFAKENLLHQASQSRQAVTDSPFETLADLRLIDATGQRHQVALRDYTVHDMQPLTVVMYVLGWLKFLLAFATARIGKMTRQKRYFLLSSVLLGWICFLSTTALGRQWAVGADDFHTRLIGIQFIYRLYYVSLIVIWLATPFSLLRRFGLAKVLVAVSLTYTMMTWGQYFFFADIPNQRTQAIIPLFITSMLGFVAFYCQWCFVHRHADAPLSVRIAMRWMLIFIVGCGLVSHGLHILWQLAWIEGRFVNVSMFITSVFLSIGIAALLLHEHLYQVEKWWWQIWSLLGALTLGFISLRVLGETGLGFSLSNMAISGLLSVLCYLFIVNSLRMKYARAESQLLELALPDLMAINAKNLTGQSVNNSWQRILRKVFQPKQIALRTVDELPVHYQAVEVARIEQGGEILILPAIDGHVVELSQAANGLKLFSPNSLQKANMLWEMVSQSYQASMAYRAGEAAERKRIAYDLHDDLGGKLLHLSSQSGEFGEYASRTLQDLRTLTHALSDDARTFATIIADIRYHLHEFCDHADIELFFDNQLIEHFDQHTLTAQAALNVTCVFNELTRNALQHDETTTLRITIKNDATHCYLRVENNGATTRPDEWIKGLGTVSTERRVNQLSGRVDWQSRDGGGVICDVQWLTEKMYAQI